ncbi:hypothetical protein F4808DRAFT_435974 [Astrocystis sublimbata]|nr:hypothetical protein F4808DRAFT_435974 [Astrocystis sublimbata]
MFCYIKPRNGVFAFLFLGASHVIAASDLTTAEVYADGPPSPPLDGCTLNSILAPIWHVDAFKYEEDDGDGASTANFILSSRMIASQLKCFGRAEGRRQSVQGECISEDGKDLSTTQFSFGPSSRDLSIEPAWSCEGGDVRDPVNFVGNGTARLDIDCEWTECTVVESTRILVKLYEPLEISPNVPPPPPGHNTPGCSSRSKSPSWSIRDFTWHVGTTMSSGPPNPITGIPSITYLSFEAGSMKVKNEAIQQTFECVWQAFSEGSQVEPREIWSCNTYSEEEVKTPRHTYEDEISFRHISSENRLVLNQTWYCDDEGRDSPEKFHATGSIEVPRVDFPTQISQPSNFTIEGKLESHYEMEPDALELPNAEAARCTVVSLDAQRFFLIDPALQWPTNWEYNNSTTSQIANFNLFMRFPFQDDYYVCRVSGLELHPAEFDPERWWDCPPISQWDPQNLKDVGFNYNHDTAVLSVNATWTCDDMNGTPIYFHAYAMGNIGEPECNWDDTFQRQHCTFPALGTTSPPFSLPFTKLTLSS